jgi:hypothetical protein
MVHRCYSRPGRILWLIPTLILSGCGGDGTYGFRKDQVYVVQQDESRIDILSQLPPGASLSMAIMLDSQIKHLARGDKLRVIEVCEEEVTHVKVRVLSGSQRDAIGWITPRFFSPHELPSVASAKEDP